MRAANGGTIINVSSVAGTKGRANASAASPRVPRMRAANGGTIINVSSVAGKKGWANASAYCASKFGLTGLTQALADEGRGHGIRAIVLYPGAMATNCGAVSPDERRQREQDEAPATRALRPERVADFIAWLAASPPEF